MKTTFFLLITLLFSFPCLAQTSIANVPDNAVLVIKYSGENLTKSVPVSKIDSYDFIQNKLFQMLGVDSLSSIQQTGINLEKDICQYLQMEDSAMSFVTLIPLKNVNQFITLMQGNNSVEIISSKDKVYKFMTIADDKYLGWTDQFAVLVFAKYTRPANYFNYPEDNKEEEILYDSTETSADSAVAEIPEITPNEDDSGSEITTIQPDFEDSSEIGSDSAWITDNYDTYDYSEDSLENAKREQWYKEMNLYINAKQKFVADSIMNVYFSKEIRSIEKDIRYAKIIDPAAPVSVWFNYDNLMSRLWTTVYLEMYRYLGGNYSNSKIDNRGFSTGINFYFHKDKISVIQKLFSPDKELAKLGRDMYKSKQSSSLINYINPDNIAFFSASFNTEAVGKYYYRMMKQYLGNSIFLKKEKELVDILIDFLEIAIDEKSLAEVMPGNMIFVLHDITTKPVSYTTYEYDEDFNEIEVTKTKKELSPNFTFAMETERPDFLQKLVNLPAKYAEKENFNYFNRGNYYELVFDPEKDPINRLYFMVKDEKLVITTAKEMLDITLTNEKRELPVEIKKSVLRNNYSFRINTQKLLQQIDQELNSETSHKMKTYLEQNLGNFTLESKIKNGMIQSFGTLSIKGKHSNSFEYLFNMIENINEILSKDATAPEEKFD